jgi:hypothetical protein
MTCTGESVCFRLQGRRNTQYTESRFALLTSDRSLRTGICQGPVELNNQGHIIPDNTLCKN